MAPGFETGGLEAADAVLKTGNSAFEVGGLDLGDVGYAGRGAKFELPSDYGTDMDGFKLPSDYGADLDRFRLPDGSGEDEDSLKLSDNGGRDSSHSTDAPAKDKDKDTPPKDTPSKDSPYDKDGKLIPSNDYELNGYSYKTDKQGRIISASGSLSLGQAERNRNAQKKVGKLGGDSGYDGGHIIGKQFGGDGNIGNLIPMKSELNQAGGDYYKMEKELKDGLLEGCTVSIDVQMEYDGDSAVPTKIIVTYQIDGELVKKVFDNL